jgi:CxxC motif-containing protein
MKKLTCIICPKGCEILVETSLKKDEYEIKGNQCPRGFEYALSEMTSPKRSITSTVKTVYKEVPRLPVRTDKDIDLRDVFLVMRELNKIEVSHPMHSGEVVAYNILGTGANIIITSDMYELLEG